MAANIAGNPDAHRFRAQRARGRRGLNRTLSGKAAPRSFTSGVSAARAGGGGGAGGGAGAGSQFTSALPVGGHTRIGHPATGLGYKIIGLYRVGSAHMVIG